MSKRTDIIRHMYVVQRMKPARIAKLLRLTEGQVRGTIIRNRMKQPGVETEREKRARLKKARERRAAQMWMKRKPPTPATAVIPVNGEYERQVAEFLARGGRVIKCPTVFVIPSPQGARA